MSRVMRTFREMLGLLSRGDFTQKLDDGMNEMVEALELIPGIFMVAVPAFVDGEKVRIPARLRYRIKAGEIIWFYQLYRWEAFLREQVQRDLIDAANASGLPFYEGAAER